MLCKILSNVNMFECGPSYGISELRKKRDSNGYVYETKMR